MNSLQPTLLTFGRLVRLTAFILVRLARAILARADNWRHDGKSRASELTRHRLYLVPQSSLLGRKDRDKRTLELFKVQLLRTIGDFLERIGKHGAQVILRVLVDFLASLLQYFEVGAELEELAERQQTLLLFHLLKRRLATEQHLLFRIEVKDGFERLHASPIKSTIRPHAQVLAVYLVLLAVLQAWDG